MDPDGGQPRLPSEANLNLLLDNNKKSCNKRNRCQLQGEKDSSEEEEEDQVLDNNSKNYRSRRRRKAEPVSIIEQEVILKEPVINESTTINTAATGNLANMADSEDSDYDDLIDDFAVPTDMDDFLDEEFADDENDDQSSTASTRTDMSSTGSVGSNTPSLVGENLESFTLAETSDSKGTNANNKQALVLGGPVVKNTEPPLRRSLFSHVPPSMNFVHHNEVPETPLPAELRKNLRWKLSNITPAVVKKVVTNSGFRLMRKNCTEWGGTWGKHMKSAQFKETVGECSKINHFPGTFNIGRKDRLWKNYQKLRVKHGKEEFNFLPRTFCLPQDAKLLRKVWEKRGVKAKWIIKPPAMARGTGIKVINKWNQIPKGQQPLVVQRYIARPHLINNTKYDLRIYVLMTSLNPLRIYLYDEGLVRFASNEYAADNESLSDVFMHLTNYSINKNNAAYVSNEDPEVRQGHKWTLASLWQYFAENGIDQKAVWERIKDMVVKTLISAEHCMYSLVRTNLNSHYCGYELFGFDVLLDADLKPWLIEVNISPSLHSASPLDLEVKSPLATEVFNIARYHVPNKISPRAQKQILAKLNMEDVPSLCFEPKLYTRDLSKADKAKQNRICGIIAEGEDPSDHRIKYLSPILEKLTPDDVRCLIRAEDELAQCTHFSRIFPTQDTHKYFRFFQQPRYHNLLFDAWEHKYGDCRSAGIDRLEQLCVDKVHLKIPLNNTPATNCNVSVLKGPNPAEVSCTTTSSLPSVMTAEKQPQNEQTEKVVMGKPPPKLGYVAKPANIHGTVRKSSSSSSVGSSSAAAAASTSKTPEEPMSTGGESSRSPSPKAVI